MLPTTLDNLSGASMHVHLELEAAILEGEDERVVDSHHGSDGELALTFSVVIGY